MSDGMALAEKLQREILELPPESLPDLEKFVEFLRFKAKPNKAAKTEPQRFDPTQARKLHGILKGYDFSPEFIKEARREMWRKFYVEDER